MNEVIIRMISLPTTVRAFTIADSEGCYNIYLNSLLSNEEQKKGLRHEQTHIERGDFYASSEIPGITRLIEKLAAGTE